MSSLFALIVAIISWPPTAWWRAFVFIKLWDWFVLPVWHVPTPVLYYVVGAIAAFHVVAIWPQYDFDSDDNSWTIVGNSLVHSIVVPATFLAFGWIWKWLGWGL